MLASWAHARRTDSSEMFCFLRNAYSCNLRKKIRPARLPCNSAALIANEIKYGEVIGFSIHRSPSQLIPVRLAVFSHIDLNFWHSLGSNSFLIQLISPVVIVLIVKNRPY